MYSAIVGSTRLLDHFFIERKGDFVVLLDLWMSDLTTYKRMTTCGEISKMMVRTRCEAQHSKANTLLCLNREKLMELKQL